MTRILLWAIASLLHWLAYLDKDAVYDVQHFCLRELGESMTAKVQFTVSGYVCQRRMP